MKQKHALVTGATGFVGSRLAKHLLSEGWVVHVIVRPDSCLGELTPIQAALTVHQFDGKFDLMRSIVNESRPDVVFHLASLFLSEHQTKDIERLVDSNLLFGTQLVEAMSLEGVHSLVNTGTSWQHYENNQYSPVNLYAATKQAFEALLQYYVEARHLRVITLKLFDTYGPNDPRNKLINLLLNAARTGANFSLSPGEQLIDFVHVDDVVRAYTQAAMVLLAGQFLGHHSFGVSSGAPLSLKDLVGELEQALGLEIPVLWGGRSYRTREVMSPFQPAAPLPGWKAQVHIKEGLKTLL